MTTVNGWDIAILAALAAAVALALRRVLRTRKTGGCGCGCEGCARQCKKRNEE